MTFKAEPITKRANYYSIKEASFRLPSNLMDTEALRREYTNPKTGEKGVAIERAYKALFGVISDVSFVDSTLKDGTVLRSLHVCLGEDDNGVSQIISIPVDGRFATDFLKRLPNIDLEKEVRLMPYDFEKDGPRQVGISIYHKDDADNFTIKVDNNFFTKVEGEGMDKKYTNLHGFPEPTDEDSSDWPFYFKKVNKFLVNYAKTNVLPKFEKAEKMPESYEEEHATDPLEDELDPSKIPF